jgi:hypothetical protein
MNVKLHGFLASSAQKIKTVCSSKSSVSTYNSTGRENREDQHRHISSFDSFNQLYLMQDYTERKWEAQLE